MRPRRGLHKHHDMGLSLLVFLHGGSVITDIGHILGAPCIGWFVQRLVCNDTIEIRYEDRMCMAA